MFIVHALMSLTVIAVLAFFVLFAAQKAEGLIRTFGRILGVWLLILAVLALAGAATAPMMGGRPFGWDLPRHMRDAHCYGWREDSGRTQSTAPGLAFGASKAGQLRIARHGAGHDRSVLNASEIRRGGPRGRPYVSRRVRGP